MDKQTTVGFILIAIVLVLWMWLNGPQPGTHPPGTADSTHTTTTPAADTVRTTAPPPAVTRPALAEQNADSLGKFFTHLSSGDERVLIVKTDKYTAEITTRGGRIRKWELHGYKTWDQYPVQLVDFDKGGDFGLLFITTDGKEVNTRDLYFTGDFPRWKSVELHNDESYTVSLALAIGEGKQIVKRLTFVNGRYDLQAEFLFENVQDVIANFEYRIMWEHGLPYAEHNSVDESGSAMAYAFLGGELAELDASNVGEPVHKDANGSTSWAATRNKYFAVAMIPAENTCQGVELDGERFARPDKGAYEQYAVSLKMPFRGLARERSSLTVFLGPLDYDLVKSYDRGLDQIMSLGAAWVIRPISEYVMLPLFHFLHLFIPNFGVVIIAFSIIIKVALHPLTKTQMASMKKMQALSPLMNQIREKHKDDPQKMNQAMMNLYKEYGVNPASGCLPLLLQLPILYALYSVLRSSIELRQASFLWWITDLSIPDTVIHLPFGIPLIGITALSGLALAMGLTMFIQQKMTVTDPRQKAMVWMMPIMMTLMFTALPSGLNLYYFTFNLLSIGQQFIVNKQHNDEPLRKVDPKKRKTGFMERLTRDLPKLKQ